MDPRLEFTFQLLIDATGLPRGDLMDYIFDGNMLDEINQLFLPYMRNKLLWFYQEVEEVELPPPVETVKPSTSRGGQAAAPKVVSQPISIPKKKLFLTDGWQVPLTGTCIFMFRLNTGKQLPEEGFHKDLFCGVVDGLHIGLVASVERTVEYVFMEALAFPSPDAEEDEGNCPTVKNQLLPGLRSFCSALRVCEEVCGSPNIFDDNQNLMINIHCMDDMRELIKQQEEVTRLEERIKAWMKRVQEVLMESQQLRKENDSSGPQDELEYWKRRGAQFSQIVRHLQAHEVHMTLLTLQVARSKLIKQWRDTDRKITFCYNEARDNAKFIQSMEKCCHSLYLHDPVRMRDSIMSMLQTVRLIHSVSQFYNTSERTSSLMVKITNQMIETCKMYITCRGKETIWSQDRAEVRTKLEHCIKLNKTYRNTYVLVKSQPFIPGQDSFGFSENYVFGKFDTFCERLNKIITMFNLVDDYNNLFARRMEGLLLGEELENKIYKCEEAKAGITSKTYDYLDHRNSEFDADFDIFLKKTDKLKEGIGALIEENFSSVWETPQGIRFLIRFEKVSEKIPLTKMEEKYDRVLKYCEHEVDRIFKLFRKQKDDPPLSRNFPPIAGRIKWVRSLHSHLEELVMEASSHPVLKTLPVTIELLRRYNIVSSALVNYETEMKDTWMKQNVWLVDESLNQKLLALSEESGQLRVNLDHQVKQLIREADCLAKMGMPMPIVTNTLLLKADHFTVVSDSLQLMLSQFLAAVRRVKLEVRPLFLPQLVRLSSMLSPGLHKITWTDAAWKEFHANTTEAIKSFDILVTRVHDVYTNRILQVLTSMQKVTLQALPSDDPWTVEEFLDRTEETCRHAAMELHRKSLMVEEAVEEVLELVRKAALAFKANSGVDEFDFLVEEIYSCDNNCKLPDEGTDGDSSQQQQDWSIVWEYFDNPQKLLGQPGGGLSKVMQDMVRNAVAEMRRYYSRKVVDVLIKVTRHSLDCLRKRFSPDSDISVFLLHATLMIPKVVVRPSLEEVQEALVAAGKYITGVSKGIGQWTGGKIPQQILLKFQKKNMHTCKSTAKKTLQISNRGKTSISSPAEELLQSCNGNKEVMKMLSLLSMCTQDIKLELGEFLERWVPYKFLWKNIEQNKREMLNASLNDFESWLRRHCELESRLSTEPDQHLFGSCLAVSAERLKFGLLTEIKTCTHRIGQVLKKKYRREMDYVYAVINEMDRKLDRPIRDLDDVRMVMDTLKKIREQEVDMELKIDPIEEAFNVVTRYELPVDREDLEQVDNLRYTWQQLLARAQETNCLLLSLQPQFAEDLRRNLECFRQDTIQYCHDYRTSGPMMPGLTPREASDRLLLFQNQFDGMWRKLQTYQSGEELFGMPQTDYPELGTIRKELNLLQKLYKLYNDVIDRVSSYYDIPWGESYSLRYSLNGHKLNEIKIQIRLIKCFRCRKLPKALKEWPAFHALKRTVDDFNDMCPLLELMANKAMKPRHWQRIMEVLKHNFDLESENFCLKNILEAPLLKYKEDIEDICISAMKEKDIEAKLRQVTNEWTIHELTFQTFNNRGELLLRGDTTAETIGQLEDSLMILGSLMSNRYNPPFRKQIQQWVTDLGNTNEILERWLLVQNLWVYLEAVFVGGDIAKQLPKEAKRFSKIDKSWQKIMQRAHETPGVVACCVGDDLLKQLLPHLQEQLELCQKSLSGYLEKKRMMFPRFFFVSDPALLEILGQASDSHTIQNHLLSIFDNTRFVKFHDVEYNKMTAIISSEGESIQLERAVRAEGSVETWLTSLLQTSQQSLHAIIRQAFTMINDLNFNLLSFLDKMPAQ
ncbi:hypothetical protein L9F63_015614, partial [Diploptera punctata]